MASKAVAALIPCIRALVGDEILDESEVPEYTDEQLIQSIKCAIELSLTDLDIYFDSENNIIAGDISADNLALISLYAAQFRLSPGGSCNIKTRAFSFTENYSAKRDYLTFIANRISKLESGVAIGAKGYDHFVQECRYRFRERIVEARPDKTPEDNLIICDNSPTFTVARDASGGETFTLTVPNVPEGDWGFEFVLNEKAGEVLRGLRITGAVSVAKTGSITTDLNAENVVGTEPGGAPVVVITFNGDEFIATVTNTSGDDAAYTGALVLTGREAD